MPKDRDNRDNNAEDETNILHERLSLLEEQIRNSQRIGQIGSYVWDNLAGRLKSCSEQYAAIHGLSVPQVLSDDDDHLDVITHPDDRERLLKQGETFDRTGEPFQIDYRIIRTDGEIRHLREIAEPAVFRDGFVIEQHGIIQDITEQKEQELALEQAQSVAHMGSWHLDLTKKHLAWSDQIFEIFGIEKEKFGASLEAFFDCIHPDDLESVQMAYQASVDEDIPYDIEHRIVKRDSGEVRWVHERCIHERLAGGEVIRSIGTVQDITQRKEAEEKLRQSEQALFQRSKDLEMTNAMLEQQAQEMAQLAEDLHHAKEEVEVLAVTDRLTGLFNRLKLDQSFLSELDRSKRYGHPLSVVIFDLDHFKSVNDTFGHQAGDGVLIAVARILKDNSRTVDIPGRWGGEEFLVICPETNLSGAKALAEKNRQAIEACHFPEVGHITASFGIAQYTDGDSIEALTHRADKALYRAKRSGRNCVEVE